MTVVKKNLVRYSSLMKPLGGQVVNKNRKIPDVKEAKTTATEHVCCVAHEVFGK